MSIWRCWPLVRAENGGCGDEVIVQKSKLALTKPVPNTTRRCLLRDSTDGIERACSSLGLFGHVVAEHLQRPAGNNQCDANL